LRQYVRARLSVSRQLSLVQAPADEDGRGLTLVEALPDRWGSLPANGSKIVWFALATDGSAGRERYLTA